jgi:hypothetical protein
MPFNSWGFEILWSTMTRKESFVDENKPNEVVDPEEFKCHARRHMPGHCYKTYDAMMGQAHSKFAKAKHVDGTPWVFNGSIRPTLCNWTNTGKSALEESIKWLVEHGWLIRVTPEGKHRRWYASGRIAPTEYIILSHDEFVANRGTSDCPPYAYQKKDDKEKGLERGQKLGPKETVPENFELSRVVRDKAKQLGWPQMAKYLGSLDEEARANIVAHLKKGKR